MTSDKRACASGKKRYSDQSAAEASLARIRRRRPYRGERRAYLCIGCHGWHLTSQNRTTPAPSPTNQPCPTPRRVPHPNQAAAEAQRLNDFLLNNATHYPYKCRCSAWHLSVDLTQELPTYEQPHPEDVARISHLTQADFTDLVDADVKRTAPMRDRLALRHPDNNTRWRWALKALQREVQHQLAADGPDTWRDKALFYDAFLNDRLDECQAHRARNRALRLPQSA